MYPKIPLKEIVVSLEHLCRPSQAATDHILATKVRIVDGE